MLKIYSIQGFSHILKQQNNIHKYVLQKVKHMHFTPRKLIKFESSQMKHIKSLHYKFTKFKATDIITISTTTNRCKITRGNKIVWEHKIDKGIVERC